LKTKPNVKFPKGRAEKPTTAGSISTHSYVKRDSSGWSGGHPTPVSIVSFLLNFGKDIVYCTRLLYGE
jgi:hypothetical protein